MFNTNTELHARGLRKTIRVGLALIYLTTLAAGCSGVDSHTPQPGSNAARATDIADKALLATQAAVASLQAPFPSPVPPIRIPRPPEDPTLDSQKYIEELWQHPPREFKPEKPIYPGDPAVAAEDTWYINQTGGTAIEIDLEALKTLRGLYDPQHAPAQIVIASEHRNIFELLEDGTIRVGFTLPDVDADTALNLKIIAAYELVQLNIDQTQLLQEGTSPEIVAQSRALVKLAVYNRLEYEVYTELAAKFGLIAYPEYDDFGDHLYYGMVVMMGYEPAPFQIAGYSSP